jgi:hypothetical protein
MDKEATASTKENSTGIIVLGVILFVLLIIIATLKGIYECAAKLPIALKIKMPAAPFGPPKYPPGDAEDDAYRDPPTNPLQLCTISDEDKADHEYTRKAQCFITKPNFTVGPQWTTSPDVQEVPADSCKDGKYDAYRADTGEPIAYAGNWPVEQYSYSVDSCNVVYSVDAWGDRSEVQ